MPECYASPDIDRLISLANHVLERSGTVTMVRVDAADTAPRYLWINRRVTVAQRRQGLGFEFGAPGRI
jgi:hypothetical protein